MNRLSGERNPLWLGVLGLAAAVGLLLVGCRKEAQAVPPSTLVRLHWLGASQVGADTNAATLKQIWNLPESVALKNQTLDKLAAAPWTLAGREVDSNAVAVLRPLLEDVIDSESRFELTGTPDQPLSWTLAMRLDPQRSQLWGRNLSTALQSFTGSAPDTLSGDRPGWVIQSQQPPGLFAFRRSGNWTVVGRADGMEAFDHAVARLLSAQSTPGETNGAPWLAGRVDLPELARVLDIKSIKSENLPAIAFTLKGRGDGKRISTDAQFTFAKPLDIQLPAWNVPTNLIDKNQTSITAVRGIAPWVSSMRWWKDLKIGRAPDQVFIWAIKGNLAQTYFAAEVAAPEKSLDKVVRRIMGAQDHWFGSKPSGGFRRNEASHGLEWRGVPFMTPFLTSLSTHDETVLFGGGFSYNAAENPLGTDFSREALTGDKLILFDWEHTGERIGQWFYMGQFIRLVTGKPQLDSALASHRWLTAISRELGQSVTRVSLMGPRQLSFLRTSTLGLTAVELHLMADWLESYQFPKGLYTFTAPAPQLSDKRTNAPPWLRSKH